MLLKKLADKPFETEYPMPTFDRVDPQPAIKDLSKATIALCTSGGIVPKGNPTTSKVQMPHITENMTSQVLWILQKRHTKQLMVDMTRYMQTKIQTVYFL